MPLTGAQKSMDKTALGLDWFTPNKSKPLIAIFKTEATRSCRGPEIKLNTYVVCLFMHDMIRDCFPSIISIAIFLFSHGCTDILTQALKSTDIVTERKAAIKCH